MLPSKMDFTHGSFIATKVLNYNQNLDNNKPSYKMNNFKRICWRNSQK